jgi:hypothetical protein
MSGYLGLGVSVVSMKSHSRKAIYNELVWRPTVKKMRSDRGGMGG